MTTTTHTTLRGPRGRMVLCTEEFADSVDKGCPLVLGGPLPHVMAAKAVAFKEALDPSFAQYAEKIVENSRALAEACIEEGITVATGGTDNHLMLIDLRGKFQNVCGKLAEKELGRAAITLNKNMVPFDSRSAFLTSGLRVGTPAVTSRGFKEEDVVKMVDLIDEVLCSCAKWKDMQQNPADSIEAPEHLAVLEDVKRRVHEMTAGRPLNAY